MNKPKPGLRSGSAKTRGASLRAQRRNQNDAQRTLSHYATAKQKSPVVPQTIADPYNKLKVTFLGGMHEVGEKNMTVIEYQDDAIILDCGNSLGVDLPGVNYEINDPAYLEVIKHKIKAYVITHGHLDHIGGLRHIVPQFPAPIYGSRYTTGIIARSFEDEHASVGDFTPELVTVNIDNHERLKLGNFFVEFIRVTHSIPDPTAVCITTPAGSIIATGDFRLDPEPLDHLPSDKVRLKELGDQGVLLLLSESSYADIPGRTPTEHTLQASFDDLITNAPGRVFVSIFSSNINRIQMIITAAAAAGRKVALDGRSMLGFSEVAVRQGILKVPKGTIVAMQQVGSIPADQLLVLCTGGQGEPGAALQRMSEGEHTYVNLDAGDTVIISSSPIPGNEIHYDQLSNRLSKKGVHLFRHPTHELDGCGPLHVSGHAKRDELREMIQLVRPKFFIPVHGGALRRRYHADLGIEEGIPRGHVLLPDNGDSLFFTASDVEAGGQVPHGSLLVDQNGSVVSSVVVKDRLLLAEEGIVTIILTVDSSTGRILTSPDIVSRGFIHMRDDEALLGELRTELRRVVQQRFQRVALDRFKAELRDYASQFLFEKTGLSPIIIPVVNKIAVGKQPPTSVAHNQPPKAEAPTSVQEQQRFRELRRRLLTQNR